MQVTLYSSSETSSAGRWGEEGFFEDLQFQKQEAGIVRGDVERTLRLSYESPPLGTKALLVSPNHYYGLSFSRSHTQEILRGTQRHG